MPGAVLYALRILIHLIPMQQPHYFSCFRDKERRPSDWPEVTQLVKDRAGSAGWLQRAPPTLQRVRGGGGEQGCGLASALGGWAVSSPPSKAHPKINWP